MLGFTLESYWESDKGKRGRDREILFSFRVHPEWDLLLSLLGSGSLAGSVSLAGTAEPPVFTVGTTELQF